MNTQGSYWDIIAKWETLHGWDGDLYDDDDWEGKYSAESLGDDVVVGITLVLFAVMQDFRKVMAIHEA